MSKVYLQDWDISKHTKSIIQQMARSNWKPDLIVGLSRGGLIPAVNMSHYFDVPMWPLKVSLRDDKHVQDSSWMAEEAYKGARILIVDDINDSGATLDLIKKSWIANHHPDDMTWNVIWGTNVRVAVLVNNISSNFDDVTYSGLEINKAEDDAWIVFPWEDFK